MPQVRLPTPLGECREYQVGCSRYTPRAHPHEGEAKAWVKHPRMVIFLSFTDPSRRNDLG
jgi:hypothetical protein